MYVQAWIDAPVPHEAAVNDLVLMKRLIPHRALSQEVANTGLEALGRHLWYLDGELVPFAFFSDQFTVDDKREMADAINDPCDASGSRLHRIKGNPDQLSQQKLADFINTSSRFFFEILQLPTSFLGRGLHERLHEDPMNGFTTRTS